MLVLHYTGMVGAEAALDRLCDPAAKVSAHYLIDEDGTVFALVPEEKRAWHAGVAAWRGNRDVNARSIGIELANPGHEFIYRDFPNSQMAALTDLATDILARHAIPSRNVVGHSDLAPDRKLDPGERFDWQGLAAGGIGLWPARPRDVGEDPMALLAEYGYDVSARHAVAAFQRHFRPGKIDGVLDPETLGLLGGLIESVRGV
ncbi:MAG: N-acetylmuramoyl-L-alanine amidase [Pseudomonadota bacterium]